MSCGASRLSKPMEAFISSMISAGEAIKRPPHMRLAGLSVTGSAPSAIRSRRRQLRKTTVMSENTEDQQAPLAKYLWLAALSALAAFAAVYVMLGRPDNDSGAAIEPSGQRGRSGRHRGTSPLSTGAMTTFVFKQPPAPLPDVAFVNAEGKPVEPQGLERQGRAAEPVGDLVRALPRGDAGARPPAGGARLRQVRGRGARRRQGRPRGREEVPATRPRRRSSNCTPTRPRARATS